MILICVPEQIFRHSHSYKDFFCNIKVLEMVRPPYSTDFAHVFLPLMMNESLNNTLKPDEERRVQDFLSFCKSNSLMEVSVN